MWRVLLLTALTFQSVLAYCDDDWSQFGHVCIYINPEEVTWYEARNSCKKSGGRLVEDDSEKKNNFIVDQMKRQKVRAAWIGGKKGEFWKWVPREEEFKGYSNWGKGQPDNFGENENCLSISKWYQFMWNDRACNTTFSFVCEKRHSK